jgi:carbon monoxide dehydrogenase subunit G
MHIADSFVVPVDVDRVAPCMPGAELQSFDGEAFTGTVAVKLGALSMKYAGTGRFLERDAAAGRVVFEVSGRETRGSGTARATVTATLHPEPGQTRVDVDTELVVSGRAAQFGRSIMNDVAGRLLGQFSRSLSAQITAPAVEVTPAGPAAPDARPAPDVPAVAAAEPLDLAVLGRQVILTRVALPLAVVAMLVVLIRLLRRR